MITSLSLANLRAHWSSFLATFLAVTLGVGLLSAALIVDDSSRPDVQPRLADSAALVVPPAAAVNRSFYPNNLVPWSPGEADRVVRDLRAVPGAAAVVADRSFYAQAFLDGRPVGNPDDDEAGHGWSSAQLGPAVLVDGAPPRAANEIVVDRSLGVVPGGSLQVNLATGLTPFRVSGVIDGPGFYLSDARAAALAPGVSTIGVVAAPGASADEVAAATTTVVADRGSVLAGSQRGAVEPGWLAHERFLGTQVIVAMAVIALFTTVFVVGSTVAVSLAGRRRELGLLRTVGAAPRQIRRMVLVESAGIGLAGGVAGCVLGTVLAPMVQAVLRSLDASPDDAALSVSFTPLLLSALVGVVVAVVGAWIAGRRAARVAPLEALHGDGVTRRGMTRGRWLAGLGALGIGVVLAIAAGVVDSDARMGLALTAAMGLIVAAALLAPVVIGPLTRELTAPAARRSSSAGLMLLRAEVLAATSRAAAIAAPVIAAVGFAVLLSGMVSTMSVAYPASQTDQLAGQTMVDVDGTPGLTDQVLREIGPPPGTKASLPTQAFVPGPEGTVVVDAIGSIDGALVRPGEVVVSDQMAATLGLSPGQTVPTRFVDGATVPLRVSAVLPLDPSRGSFTVTRAMVRTHAPSALGDEYYVPAGVVPPPVSAGAVLRDAQSFSLAKYETDATLSEGLVGLLVVISVGYCGLAMANSMAMSAHGRRHDYMTMRAAGGTRSQLVRAALGETAVVVGVGAVLGLVVSIPPLIGVSSGLSSATATEVGLHLDWGVTVLVVLGCLALALASSYVVVRRLVRTSAP